MCEVFFSHVTETSFSKEKTHDFSHSQINLKNMVCQILYHLRDSSSSVYGLLKSDVPHIFYDKLEKNFVSWCEQNLKFNGKTPEDLSLIYISENMISSCKWSVASNFTISPEKVSEYFVSSISAELL